MHFIQTKSISTTDISSAAVFTTLACAAAISTAAISTAVVSTAVVSNLIQSFSGHFPDNLKIIATEGFSLQNVSLVSLELHIKTLLR